MYITENGLGVDLFVHLNVICDKWTTYNWQTVVSQIWAFVVVYFRSRDVGMTGFVYYFNRGTELNDIIEHEHDICSVMYQYRWLTTEINNWCKGVLLIAIRCNDVTNFLIPSAGNQFVTVMKDATITDDI